MIPFLLLLLTECCQLSIAVDSTPAQTFPLDINVTFDYRKIIHNRDDITSGSSSTGPLAAPTSLPGEIPSATTAAPTHSFTEDICSNIELKFTITNKLMHFNDSSTCYMREWLPYRWTYFQNEQGDPLDILSFSSTDSLCIQPGYCGSSLPWYIFTDTRSSSPGGTLDLCMGDVSSQGLELCCLRPIQISVQICADFTLYLLTENIPSSLCGGLCTVSHSQAGVLNPTSLPTRLIVRDREAVPLPIESLAEEVVNKSVTITFTHEYGKSAQFNEMRSINKLNAYLLRSLNEKLRWARKRRALHFRGEISALKPRNLRTVRNSPKTIEYETHHVLYIKQDSGELIDLPRMLRDSTSALSMLRDVDVAEEKTSRVSSITPGVSDSLFPRPPLTQPPVTLTSTSTTPSMWYSKSVPLASQSPSSATREADHLWLAIFYILGVVVLIALGLVTGALCYMRCRFCCQRSEKYEVESSLLDNKPNKIQLKLFKKQQIYSSSNGSTTPNFKTNNNNMSLDKQMSEQQNLSFSNYTPALLQVN